MLDKTYAQQRSAEHIIISLMDTAASRWNQGNLNAYMSLYASSATMMMPQGRVSLDSIHNIYLKYYFKEGKPLQNLSYNHYEFTMLGPNYALLTGQFILKGTDIKPERKGSFSVIFTFTGKQWKLMHDHSG